MPSGMFNDTMFDQVVFDHSSAESLGGTIIRIYRTARIKLFRRKRTRIVILQESGG